MNYVFKTETSQNWERVTVEEIADILDRGWEDCICVFGAEYLKPEMAKMLGIGEKEQH